MNLPETNQVIKKKISKVHDGIAGHHVVERTLKKLNEQKET